MFWTIVWAILLVEVWLPLIIWIVGSLLDEDNSVGCVLFTIAIIVLILILL